MSAANNMKDTIIHERSEYMIVERSELDGTRRAQRDMVASTRANSERSEHEREYERCEYDNRSAAIWSVAT
jgi:hypothetical protein